ncbi:hypothetical protein EC968_005173 [Mortierella alpina]|nr:hypothetical protein EC968_005173 [Mortierella alpina]
MAPNCNTSLTLRTFQMAALNDSVLDEMTGRPAKVLVCKEHVPMPKTSTGTDTLAFKHIHSAPKPSIPGLHRSLMGERGSATHSSVAIEQQQQQQQQQQRPASSPRSLAEGSHAEFLKNLKGGSNANGEDEEKEGGEQKMKKQDEQKQQQQQKDANEKGKDNDSSPPASMTTTTTTTTLPKYQRGRFTISDSDSLTAAHAAAEDAQDPKKDDDSFRNLPVRHEDYGHKEGHTAEDGDEAKNAKDDEEDWGQAEEEEEDHKQERVFTMKGRGTYASSAGKPPSGGKSSFMNKLQESLDRQEHPSTRRQQHEHGQKESGEIEVALETPVDISDRVQRDHLKIDLENDREIEAAEIKAPPGEAEEKKLVDMAFSSKLMQQHQRNKKKNNNKQDSLTAVEDDEWGTDVSSTTDSLGRREPVAGM